MKQIFLNNKKIIFVENVVDVSIIELLNFFAASAPSKILMGLRHRPRLHQNDAAP
jgi:hypothetical protein